MKKFILTIMVLTLVGILCSCGNMSLGPGNYTFEKVHVDTYHDSRCFTIEKWYDSESGVEVYTKEVGAMFLSEGTYILIEEDCPFCDD